MSKLLKVKSAIGYKLTNGKKLMVVTAIIDPRRPKKEKLDFVSNWYDLVSQVENILKDQKSDEQILKEKE